ncbi:MAG: hypothetical protein US83_C0010G0076 [Candidatus Falkowbacteria bacterium GW2011_GWC2_38_22]|uniref:Uncharacterized protein n=1 Tax=Candidatus Falkowbacteria bacterium GW2011_GWE1_38_31 TaxID=1618638 RepID=A0A0G0M959_9BACT|nr:MAG: hypothetical protein US73_C0005G0076 [Candidatus Falkowbacteria bacterium GW2011_GWF2_38_1205]KKQ61041.1 MAG: hypothetical protein US83_C0010G0076 [Candidatus Falkowbacteria bacterium GW2011_GWC2_38_22]KKQ63430.1 MAG: hypothetical protein US84_C0006G0032 [Candidatus Falkowbacteria bacterium GW2011_GWF1_38_22]KKQ65499.1 MAG: hypothetical protein US87_C0007G0076 [Candidatus Falkowbacteria bacterium GW2011_GWE2_38_254]KKQ70194.1 MAG: hypothetical protein US91_C0006G0032 [Candidatus Falkowb
MSITITLEFFLYIYLAFIVVWLIFNIVAIYHLLKYGFRNIFTFFAILFIVFCSSALLSISGNFVKQIDWSPEINLLNNSFDI